MKKILLIIALLASSAAITTLEAQRNDEARDLLLHHISVRKTAKTVLEYDWVLPMAGLSTAITVGHKNDRFPTAFRVGISWLIVHGLIKALRGGHSYVARYYFLQMYDQHVTPAGDLLSAFSPAARNYPYALDDREFIKYGFACGFDVKELVHLANKCARTEVARQLSHGEQFAETVG